MSPELNVTRFQVAAGQRVELSKDFDPQDTDGLDSKKQAAGDLQRTVEQLADFQERLYAQNVHAVLVIFQAMDAAGKDGAIKHVMSGVNPQGVRVTAFKTPSTVEQDHDYLWRCVRALPPRGQIGIFNRSYYEEVLITRVHPEILAGEQLPADAKGKGVWHRRYREINDFERYLTDNGIHVVKFFLNVSRDEQRERFLSRIDEPAKNWKFSAADVAERKHWDDYQKAYGKMLSNTSTSYAPWHVIPADHKWFTRLAVASTIVAKLAEIDPHFPTVSDEQKAALGQAREQLESD
ncbi:MAG TPA: polyphosphate kinase 2 family protein [Mycobacteriales bacterium]|jgi:PPK2 family polyphosphate:nucleotide phosphotransferase|nr:polyphosphate kinase 2 family protein [Mycobacteriales bacterium]